MTTITNATAADLPELADVRAAFYRRPDVKVLPRAQREARWVEAAPNVARFLGVLATNQNLARVR